LYDNFIVTKIGKELAKPLNDEMIEFMNNTDNDKYERLNLKMILN
jgi:hypothetical protein